MIELTAQDGAKVAVNVAMIWHIRRASGEQTAIYAATGSAIFVQESYEDIIARLQGGAFKSA